MIPFDRPAWFSKAACRGVNPDLFFPERGETASAAKQVCASCPVRGECLDYAQAGFEQFGVWGGLSERERRERRLARTRRAPAARERRAG